MHHKEIKRRNERQRQRIKRAWDSGVIHAKIAQRDRTEDNLIRAKLDRKGSLLFVVTLEDGSKTRVEWSRKGRTDQVDLVDDGVVTFTGRPDLATKELMGRAFSVAASRAAC